MMFTTGSDSIVHVYGLLTLSLGFFLPIPRGPREGGESDVANKMT